MILNSIKWRLQIWYGLILVAVLVGFGVTAFHLERGRVMRRVDEELHRRVNALLPHNRNPGERPFDGPPPNEENPGMPPSRPFGPRGSFRPPPPPGEEWVVPGEYTERDTNANAFYCALQFRDGTKFYSSNAPPAIPLPESTKSNREPQPPRMRGMFREAFVITPRGGVALVGHNIKPELEELRQVMLELAAVGGAILLLGLAGGWWLVARAIRPIDDISVTAVKISSGDLSQRIQTGDTESELGRLATVLNSTFARLETSFAQQQQFTSDAAHELRTPVSIILTQTQSTLNKERSAGEYRETLEACQRAAQRMRRLTESLLQLARLDAGQETLRREPFNLAATAQNSVELLQPMAAEKRVTIQADLTEAKCSGDSDRVAQVITNLLSNAIKYNQDGGEIRVATRSENGLAILTVADSGPGISAEDLPRVFERFYRADKSRTNSQGNAGLGLAICKAIVEAHGGTIEVTSEAGRGTTFTVRLSA